MYLFKSFTSIIVMVFSIIIFLTDHIEDGNIWGIYLENGRLFIGDFWSAIAVITLFFGTYVKTKEIVKYVYKLSEEER